MFQFTRPKFIFCDSSCIPEVRKAIQMIGMESTTKLITVDRKVDGLDTVLDMLEPIADEELFMYVGLK